MKKNYAPQLSGSEPPRCAKLAQHIAPCGPPHNRARGRALTRPHQLVEKSINKSQALIWNKISKQSVNRGKFVNWKNSTESLQRQCVSDGEKLVLSP